MIKLKSFQEIRREMVRLISESIPDANHQPGTVFGCLIDVFANSMAMQQAEIEEYVRLLTEEMYKSFATKPGDLTVSKTVKLPDSIDFIPISFNVSAINDLDCKHEWADYVGFRESYTFCKKCDQRRA